MHRTLSYLLVILFAFTRVYAQSPVNEPYKSINSLVPFRDGKYWGLVYADGAPFYPSVFDTVYVGSAGVFYSWEGKLQALVRLKGKLFYLQFDKKLLPTKVFFENQNNDIPAIEKILDESESTSTQTITAPPAIVPKIVIDSFFISGQRDENIKVMVTYTDGKYHFYKNGKHLLQFDSDIYLENPCFNDYGCWDLLVKQNDKFGLASLKNEKFIIAPRFDWVRDFGSPTDLLIVRENDRYGVINHWGTAVVPVQYRYIEPAQPGDFYKTETFVARDDKGYFFLSLKSGKTQPSTTRYDTLSLFLNYQTSRGWYITKRQSRFILIYSDETLVLPQEYDKIEPVNNRFVLLQLGKKYGYLDLYTQTIKPPPMFSKVGDLIHLDYMTVVGPYYVYLVQQGGTSFYVGADGKEFRNKLVSK